MGSFTKARMQSVKLPKYVLIIWIIRVYNKGNQYLCTMQKGDITETKSNVEFNKGDIFVQTKDVWFKP